MKKMKLNVEALAVESFDTSGDAPKRGTVFGEQCTCYTNCTCPGCPTCDASCNGTCAGTCAYTCDDATCAYTCDDASCAGTCDGCNYSDVCDTNMPCPTAQYSNCGRIICY